MLCTSTILIWPHAKPFSASIYFHSVSCADCVRFRLRTDQTLCAIFTGSTTFAKTTQTFG